MAFVVKKNPTFEKTVVADIPKEKAGKDDFESVSFKVTYRFPTDEEVLGVVEEYDATETLLDSTGKAYEHKFKDEKVITPGLRHMARTERLLSVVTGFSELLDEENNALEFTEDNFKALIKQYPQAAMAIDTKFWNSLNKPTENPKTKN
jgi:coenzyme F420-reducing hydrogenase alpha subunit